MTHTPGPWATTASGIAFSGSAGFDFEPWGNTAPISQADARLIAAAPDLLAALRDLYEHCAMVHKRWGDGSNDTEASAAIRAGQAAIAKAEGRQP